MARTSNFMQKIPFPRSLRIHFLVLYFIGAPLLLYTQNCNPELEATRVDIDARRYKDAINKLLVLQRECPEDQDKVFAMIQETFELIEKEKQEAIIQAERAKAYGLAATAQKELLVYDNYFDAIWIANEAYKKEVNPTTSQVLASTRYAGFDKKFSVDHLKEIIVSSPKPVPAGFLRPGYGYLRPIVPPENQSTTGVFSSNGKYLLTVCNGKDLAIWTSQGEFIRKLVELDSAINTVAISSDSEHICACSFHGNCRIWNAEGLALAQFDNRSSVRKLVFTPEGDELIAACGDGKLRKWNIDGELISSINAHNRGIRDLQFLHKENSFITVSTDSTAKLWNSKLELKKELFSTNGHIDEVRISPDDQRILTVSNTQVLGATKANLWTANGDSIAEMRLLNLITNAFFFPLSKLFVMVSGHQICLWDYKGTSKGCYEPFDQRRIEKVRIDQRETKLIASSNENVKIINLKGELLAELDQHIGYVASLDFSPDENLIISIDENGIANIWSRDKELITSFEHPKKVWEPTFSPDGNAILTRSPDSCARLWDRSGKILQEYYHSGGVNSAKFSFHGNYILTCSEDSTAKIWDLSGNCIQTLRNPFPLRDAVFSPNDSLVITVSMDTTAIVWDTRGNRLHKLYHDALISTSIDRNGVVTKRNECTIWNASFSPNGDYILTSAGDGDVRLWDNQGELVMSINVFADGTAQGQCSAFFLPDGKTFMTTSHDDRLSIRDLKGNVIASFNDRRWDATSYKDYKLTYHPFSGATVLLDSKDELITSIYSPNLAGINQAIYSPDGQWVLTSSATKTALLWNRKGELLAEFDKHQVDDFWSLDMQFSPDSKYVLTGSSTDGTAKLWPIPKTIFEWLKTEPIVPLSPWKKDKYRIDQ